MSRAKDKYIGKTMEVYLGIDGIASPPLTRGITKKNREYKKKLKPILFAENNIRRISPRVKKLQ
jgi:hypothetical protein